MADFITEYPYFIPFLSIMIALIGIIMGFVYFTKTSKAKAAIDKQNYAIQVENLATSKHKDEMSLAKELKEDNKQLALEVKDAMLNHISIIIDKLKQDNELQKSILLSEMNLMKQVDSQLQKDLTYHVQNQQTINDRMEKSLNFVSQFLWGQGAKSIPPYLQGLQESDYHKGEPLQGIYMHPDSSETQEMKDTILEETGKESTKSEDIEIAKELESKKLRENPDESRNYVHSIEQMEQAEEEKKAMKRSEDKTLAQAEADADVDVEGIKEILEEELDKKKEEEKEIKEEEGGENKKQ